MTTVRDIYNAIDRYAPFCSSESYDNTGILVGRKEMPVTKALLALDVTHKIIDEAAEKGVKLIITHHPVIFDPVKTIPGDGVLYRLCENGMTVISAHTNLDRAEKGVSRVLAETIGLTDITTPEEGKGFLLLGKTEAEFSAAEFAEVVKMQLNSPLTRTFDSGKTIRKVAVCSGAGSSELWAAAALGADVLVTGEVKHDRVVSAAELGLTLIDAGHYETERVILPVLRDYLSETFPEVEFAVAENDMPLFF